jgi:hypothetical protein
MIRGQPARSAAFVLVALGALTGAAALATSPVPEDGEPPLVLAFPARAQGGDVVLRARVIDPSGPGAVVLHVRGPDDTAFRAIPMEPAGGDAFEARVRASGPGAWVSWWIEATDARGNGPGQNGSATDPFFAEITQDTAAAQSRREAGWAAALVVVPLALLFLLLCVRPERKRKEREFWIEVLAPLADKRGAELEDALAVLGETTRHHPVHGEVEIELATARRWLTRLRSDSPERLVRAREAQLARESRRPPAVERSLGGASSAEIADELFWYHVLGGLTALDGAALERGLRDAAGRPHNHPVQGRRYFDVQTLRRELERVRQVDPRELLAAAGVGDGTPDEGAAARVRAGGSAGASLIELVVVSALLGIVLMIAALYLEPLEAPVQTGGELIDALIKQARAKAMAETTVHRIRPLDADSLVVEHASACSSLAWTLEPTMSLDLPRGVSLSATAWSVCFSPRGIASENLVFTLNHPEFPSRQLEILKGGTVRWLP